MEGACALFGTALFRKHALSACTYALISASGGSHPSELPAFARSKAAVIRKQATGLTHKPSLNDGFFNPYPRK